MDIARYRPDIDGLRSVAVLGVLLFHLDVYGVSGGFIGVDVFFVISGFLITRLIVEEFDAKGSFDFSRFYVRRIRRLFPALYTTCVVVLVAGFLLFSPEYFEKLARSAVFTVLSASNFHFWSEADYFDIAASTKPLLHTWSLSVEDQFYLLWPAALVFLRKSARKWVLPAGLAAAGVVSLLAAEAWLRVDPAAAFYLLPARIVEFVLGAAVVWLLRFRRLTPPYDELALVVGLALIVYAAHVFDQETPFPGWTSLVPCLGAALIIYAGTARWTGLILRNPVAVAIGRWSYSIYLVHWPLLVFYGAFTFAAFSGVEKAGLIAASIALGWLQYRFVEQVYRYERPGSLSRGRFFAVAATLALAIMIPSTIIAESDGLPGRIPAERFTMSDNRLRRVELTYCRNRDPAKPQNLFTCQNYRGKQKDIIVWGDSHALHLIAGLSAVFPDHNVYIIYMLGCAPQAGFGTDVGSLDGRATSKKCARRNRETLEFLSRYPSSTIVLSGAKRSTPEIIAPPTNTILTTLEAAGHNAFVLGDFIRPGRSLASCANVPAFLIGDAHIRKRCKGVAKVMRGELDYNDTMERLVAQYVNPNPVQCPDRKCIHFLGRKALYRDAHHMSPYGSEVLIQRLRHKLPL